MAIRPLFLSTLLLAAFLPAGAIAANNVGVFKNGQPLTLDIPISATDTCAVVIENVTPATNRQTMRVFARSLSETQLISVELEVTYGNGMFSDKFSAPNLLNVSRELHGSGYYGDASHPLAQYSVNVVLRSCTKTIVNPLGK
jgi:hypothetical protein